MPRSEPDVLIKRLDPGVPLPAYAHPGDAGADLSAEAADAASRSVLLNTDRERAVSFNRGDRIAQLVIQRVERAVFHEVAVLPGSSRGEGGFGSTGGHDGQSAELVS